MPELDFMTRSDIESAIRRIDELFACQIFTQANSRHVLFRAAFIELLIALRDLMYKTEAFSSRINFDDDVKKLARVNDVSDLIKYVRDALCHPDSENHYIEAGMKATFNVAFGRCNLLSIGDFVQASLYEDDICFFFGSHGIYLQRHVVRAFNEAKAKLQPLLAVPL
ncbi:hypothetical protein CNX70_08115 [Janthinobacterium svalbardensis]|uniref:HEPN AbiU2-like domain-containing protein n=1 Tax=Janthinobacterium svalbardensis TaxID=368607 RepID=A0A290WTE6_9BURK|nr:hypothetical protein [Janthinobacterium svalbardensis]ATD60160.1 hypothetical protein CNX70_08115 [Janthinobacterium svalbardensis]